MACNDLVGLLSLTLAELMGRGHALWAAPGGSRYANREFQ